MKYVNCLHCKNKFQYYRSRTINNRIYFEKKKNKFCSGKCYHDSTKGVAQTGKRLIKSRKSAQEMIDRRKYNPEVRQKWITKMKEITSGVNNHRWIKDRSKVVNQEERGRYLYQKWVKSTLSRDRDSCRIGNSDCSGKLEVHHILAWRDYPKLRFNINNGITLCHAHHPRVRSEEKRLIPFFEELVSVSK